MLKDTGNAETETALIADSLDNFQLSDAEQAELENLYADISDKFKAGKVLEGIVLSKDSAGVLVNINYKSDGLIPRHEFSDFELEKITLNSTIEVLLDRLEDENGCVVLSYQKAKSIKAWDRIINLAANDEPVSGVVTRKVKGGLSVDIGIPAFLPGSQVDIQRVNDFDQFVNTEVTCKILKVNRRRGNVIVSRRKHLEGLRLEEKKKALEVIVEGQVLQGVVKNITNYGAFIDIGGIDGLLHITDMSWGRIGHPTELLKIGDSVTVKVISFDKENEKISLGMKQLAKNPWEAVEDKYTIGSRVKGRVSSIADYGLFVEVEKGIEGLVHISEVSWTERISNLSKHFTVGQEIEAAVVALDKNNRRMSLSIKQIQDDPWKRVAEQFSVGNKISGTVTNVTDFGVFVQLHHGIDGLVHVSDISWTEHITHPGDLYKKGDTVNAVILSMDVKSRKISLGIKQLNEDPWDRIEEEYPVGRIVEGTISKVASFGAFVRLSSGIEGLVHISELAGGQVQRPEDVVQVGQAEKFKVIKVNKEDRKLGLSLRAAKEPHAAMPPHQPTAAPRQQPADQQRTAAPVRRERAEEKQAAPRKDSSMKGSLQQALQDFHEQRKSPEEVGSEEEKGAGEKTEKSEE